MTDPGPVDEPAPGHGPRRVRVAPLVPVALALAAGVVIDRAADPCRTAIWAALAGAGAGIALGCNRLRPRVAAWALVASLAAVGGGWHHRAWSDLAPDDLARDAELAAGVRRPCWIRGVVEEPATFRAGGGDTPGDRGSTRTVLAVSGWNDGRAWAGATGRVQVWVAGDRSDLAVGRPVQAAGTLFAIEGPPNPGEFDPRVLLRARGIRLRLAVDEPDAVWDDPAGSAGSVAPVWLARARAWSAQTLAARIDPDVAPLAVALLLGRRDGVDPDVNDAFARTGTTHLLAISGLHLQLLAVVLGVSVRALGLGRRAAFAVVAAGTLAYAILVGPAPSVARSAAMTLGVCLAGWCDCVTRPANLLAAAFIATLALNPANLFDVGGQLSFLAVAAIFWCLPGVVAWDQPELSPLDRLEREREPWWRMLGRLGWVSVRGGLRISCVVWLAAWPLVALRFHLLAPVGIPINVPLIPLTSLALLMAGLTLAAATVSTTLAGPPAWACSLLLRLCERLVRWAATCPGGHVFTPGPAWPLVVLFYVALGGAVAASTFRHPRRGVAWAGCLSVGLLLAVAPLVPVRPAHPEAEILAVGHGLATLIRSPEGRVALYDCGKMGDPHVGRRVIAPALWARDVARIDTLVISHADADHYNGLPDLLDRFPIGEVRVPPGFAGPTNPGAGILLDLVRARGVPIRPIAAGDRVDLGSVRLEVLHPAGAVRPGSSDNARSVVVTVAAAGRPLLLLTGDLERDGLPDLMARPTAPVGVLLSPHHGSRAANPAALFGWARPQAVAVSQRPPAAGTRDPLTPIAEADGFPLLRTWERGAIRLGWTSSGLMMQGFLDPPLAAFAWPEALAPHSAWWTILAGLAGFALGLALFAVIAVLEWGAWALVLPGRGLARATPRRPGELGEPVLIEVTAPDGVRLTGDWYPAVPASDRTLILLPGLAETRAAMHDRAGAIAARGWNVAALDHRAAGESGGTRLSFGTREAADLRLWLDHLAPLGGGSSGRFAVWGRSMGAATALKAAAIDPRVAAVVLEAPYLNLRRAVATLLRRLRVPPMMAGPILLRARRLAGVPLDHPDNHQTAPLVRVPVLIVHGENDRLVPPDHVKQLAALFPTPPGRLAVPDAGHADVVARGGPALLDQAGAFLDAAIPPREDQLS